MAGTMIEADLVADLKASINAAATVFVAASDGDFKRHLAVAALAFGRMRPRTLVGTLTLVADQPAYAVPSDFLAFKSSLWGIAPTARVQPWEKSWPGRLPVVRYVETAADTNKLYLDPPPTAAQISVLGAEYRYYYYARHAIHASDTAKTTILPGERGRLILRAQAEAMRELAMRNLMKPVQMRDGVSSVTRNGTPAYLYEALMKEFEGAVTA
jgi:hypothetical protein